MAAVRLEPSQRSLILYLSSVETIAKPAQRRKSYRFSDAICGRLPDLESEPTISANRSHASNHANRYAYEEGQETIGDFDRRIALTKAIRLE